ncbi:MAG: hypothetical protein WC378_13580 [Opitutaceae bacterium]|jgi:hypothetical protein
MDGSNLGFLPAAVIAGETIYVAADNSVNAWAGNDIIIPGITPAGGYTLAYSFSAATPITVNAAANGANTGWTLTVTAAQTLVWRAGTIRFTALATLADPARVYAVDSGAIKVTASPLTVSQYQAALTAVEAAIASFGTTNKRSIQQGDMSITYNSIQELLDLREFYRGEIARETSSRQKRIIRSRFT